MSNYWLSASGKNTFKMNTLNYNSDAELEDIISLSSQKNIDESMFLSYISKPASAELTSTFLVKVTEKRLTEIFNNAKKKETVAGESYLHEYLERLTLSRSCNTTKERILLYIFLEKEPIDVIQIRKNVTMAWPLSPSIHSKRIYIIHLAFQEKFFGSFKEKRKFEIKSGGTTSNLDISIRSENGNIEVLMEIAGLLPPMANLILKELEDFLKTIDVSILGINLSWVKSSAAIEWNVQGIRSDKDSVTISYETLVSKGSHYKIDLTSLRYYMVSTAVQLYNFVEWGDDYKSNSGEFNEVRKYKSTIGPEIYQETCPCAGQNCRGAKDFMKNYPCHNKV